MTKAKSRVWSTLEKLLKESAAMIRPSAKMTVAEWAEKRRYINIENAYVGPWRNDTTPYLVEVMEMLTSLDHTAVSFTASARSGKGLALDTKIPTPLGWSTMGDLKEGDLVFGKSGEPCRVKWVSQVNHIDCYRIVFDDKSEIITDGDHKWEIDDVILGKTSVLETRHMEGTYLHGSQNRKRYAIPNCAVVQYPTADQFLDPYILGIWLGDGSTRYGHLTVVARDKDETKANIEARGFQVRVYEPNHNKTAFTFGIRSDDGVPLINHLSTMGLGGDHGKFIPPEYLFADEHQRRELLRGLLDTHGSLYGNNGRTVQFLNTNRALADGVAHLVKSLGYKTRIRTKHVIVKEKYHCDAHMVEFTTYDAEGVFALPRKIAVASGSPLTNKRATHTTRRFISSIEKIESVPTKCIAVDAIDHLYLATENFIPTHNSDIFFNWLGHSLECDPADMRIYLQTKFWAEDWSQGDLERTFLAHAPGEPSPFKKHMLPGKHNNTLLRKRFISGMRLNLSFPAITELSGKTVGRVALNDYDHAEQNIAGMGPAFPMAKKRTTTFGRFGMTYVESTPAFPVKDPNWIAGSLHAAPPVEAGILTIYNHGDRRRWYWQCPNDECGEWFEPEFDLFVYDMEAGSNAKVAQTVTMQCPCCAHKIDEEERPALNRRGKWLKDGQTIDRHGVISGEGEKNDIASFWLKGPAAFMQSWKGMVLEFLNAMDEYNNTGNDGPLKLCYELSRGEPYMQPRDELARLPETLKGRAEDWGGGHRFDDKEPVVPEWVRFLVATVDVQARSFVVQVTGVGENGELTLLDMFKIRTSNRIDESDVRQPLLPIDPAGHLEDWDLLISEVIEKTYPLADGSGRRMAIKISGSDSGGREGVTTNAYNFWRKLRDDPEGRGHHRRFHLIQGEPSKSAPRRHTVYPDSNRRDRHAGARGDVPVQRLNSNLLKDQLNAILGRVEPGGARFRFPVWAPDFFYKQLCAEERTAKGWENKSGRRNEAWDQSYYVIGLCLHPDIGLEKMNWEKPPGWAEVWDKNTLVIAPENKNPIINVVRPKIDLAKIAAEMA